MRKRWLLALPLAGAGTFLLLMLSSIFAVVLPGAIFLTIMAVVVYKLSRLGRQKLLVTLPFPKNTSLKTILLLLGAEDGEVYRYIIWHGGKKAWSNGRKVQIKYLGNRVYDQKTNTFTIEGGKHVPDALSVQELN